MKTASELVIFRIHSASRLIKLVLVIAWIGAVWSGPVCQAQDVPYVAGFEAQYRHQSGNAEAGRLLVTELGCVHCHDAADRLEARPAPSLANAVQRIDPHFIRQFLLNPTEHQPGSLMPAMFQHPDADARERTATELTHYLASMRRGDHQRLPPDIASVTRGNRLFHEVGCIACHAPQVEQTAADIIAASRRFPELHNKYSVTGLSSFLKDPHTVRPAGRMPNLSLNDREARDVAQYLLRETSINAPLNYELFYGRRADLDDDENLELFQTGTVFEPALKFPHRGNDYTVRYTGFLKVDVPAEYRFRLQADDGARLWLSGELLVDNDSERTTDRLVRGEGKVRLNVGLHEFRVEYFQRRRDQVLTVEWAQPGQEFQRIPGSQFQNHVQPVPELAAWKVDPTLAEAGRRKFVTLGCNQCHQVQQRVPELSAPAFSELHLAKDAGCLSDKLSGLSNVPDFRFDSVQRKAIREFLEHDHADPVERLTAEQRIHRSMTRLNCYACHDRGEIGGVADHRRAHFATEVIELGDEGRIPPSLNGVGDKLQPSWLESVLLQRGVARPYMKARMPQFGDSQVRHLVADFIAADRNESILPEFADSAVDAKAAADAKAVGLKLVDQGGLQCIGCHDFNRHRSIGIRATDLATMPQRLNHDWFHRYLRNPGQFRPGTKMPSAWPNGRSLFPQVLDGNADRQIEAIWSYLTDGRKAIPPSGLNRQSLEIIVGGEAVVYRNKIREAGFRGICVGHPAEVNLSFDAESMRLVQIWKGRFLNAAAHWGSQGMGRIGPIGHDVLTFPTGPPLAVFTDENVVWPEDSGKSSGFQFRGYELDELRRPKFEYDFQGVAVTDFCTGHESPRNADSRILRRQLTFNNVNAMPIRMRLWVGDSVKREGSIFECGPQLTIRLPESVKAVVRSLKNQYELIVDVSDVEKLMVEYEW